MLLGGGRWRRSAGDGGVSNGGRGILLEKIFQRVVGVEEHAGWLEEHAGWSMVECLLGGGGDNLVLEKRWE